VLNTPSLSDVDGVLVGHWTDNEARTGCTVVVFPDGTVASGEVRGGSPATRDTELLAPGNTVECVDAVVLSGGSAFGLAAADGVMRWCEEHGRGIETPAGRVPIVVGLSIFDLVVGDPTVRPTGAAGHAAASVASTDAEGVGPIGAGTGATMGKWRGRELARPSGIGSATVRDGDIVVAALMVVNAWGEVVTGAEPLPTDVAPSDPFTSTTVGVVATNARLTKPQCLAVAKAAHAGLARSIYPAHSPFDGDAIVVGATGAVEAPIERVVPLADRAVSAAVRASVRPSDRPT
jgi:L-aminopeptidase/D-esterase-like protein